MPCNWKSIFNGGLLKDILQGFLQLRMLEPELVLL